MTDRVPGRHNLPQPTTSFVGRGPEVDAVSQSFERHRLVTLAGPGGAGKTRLALEVAHRLTAAFDDGVWWVDLASTTEGAVIADAAAEAVGALVDPRRGPVASVAAHLCGRRALVCLDNAEHLLDDVAALTDAILRASADVAVLVTSREPLRLPGELVWRVPPLDDDAAVALFHERAALVRPGFHPDDSAAGAIRSIVRHLDGIPLALELAAAWVAVLSPEQILAGLDDRFRLLVRGPRNASRRQQTLAGSIGWSHALLDDVDRAMLRRLAVFAAAFPLDAAIAVGGGPPIPEGEELDSLARLVDKSLVMTDEHDGEVRYRLLETIRAFAAARLTEAYEETATRDRHLGWHVAFAESADARRAHDPDESRRTLQRAYADLRLALEWGLQEGDHRGGRRLAASLAWMWHVDRRGREGIGYLRRAVELAPLERSLVQARLLTGLALVIDTADPLDLEYDAATQALELATELGDDGLRALCLNLAAVGASYTDFDEAWDLAEQAAAAAPADDAFAATTARALQALVLHHRDLHAEADALLDEVVPLLRDQHRGIASTVLSFQATGALVTGDAARARRLAGEALLVAEPLGDYLRVGMARAALAVVHARTGDLAAAEDALAPLLRLAADDDVFVTGLPDALGVLAVHRGDHPVAIEWFRRAAGTTDRGADSWMTANALAELGAVLATTGAPADAAAVLDRAEATGNRLGMPRVLALVQVARAELAAAADDPQRALELTHTALALQARHGLRAGMSDSLESLARHGAAVRPSPDDARVLGAAEAARHSLGIPRSVDQHRRVTATVSQLRAALSNDAVEAAWAEGARLDLDDAVGFARRARGARGRPSSGWASLTPTERSVTALVAEGRSNPEIAARLLMGRGTVKTHLSHIFGKLGVTNRTELASLAVARCDPS